MLKSANDFLLVLKPGILEIVRPCLAYIGPGARVHLVGRALLNAAKQPRYANVNLSKVEGS